MVADLVRTLYRYNAWANGRILDTAAGLTADQLLAGGGASFDSVRAMSAQWIYLERWQGRSPRAALDPREFPDLASIREWWDGLERRTEAFVAGLDDARLAAVVEYVNFAGERWAYPLWQQMLHQVNHATQHRSEAAVMLTHLGHSPGWLDFLYFIDLQGGVRL
jgi:uncharacterized damage-inducible protein DinB